MLKKSTVVVPESLVDTIRQIIADEMQKQGLCTAELARRAGTSRAYLHRVLNGEHSPSFDWAEKVAETLGFRLSIKKIKSSS